MAGLIILGIMATVFAILDLAALRWGVDSRIVDVDGRRSAALGTR
ncbi:MAG: hypothetical protein ACRDIL_01255 [Candidatus Limnocylindrales bacterium]